MLYPHPNVRISYKAGDPPAGVTTYLHSDQLGSVRVMTGADGASDKETTYRPFGETVDTITDATATLETKGFIPFSEFEYLKPLPRRRASGMMRGLGCNT